MSTFTRLALVLTIASFGTMIWAESETVKGMQKDVETFKVEAQSKIADLNKKISELKSKTKQQADEKQKNLTTELEASRDKLQSELNALGEKSKDKWKELRAKLSKSLDELNEKAQKALN